MSYKLFLKFAFTDLSGIWFLIIFFFTLHTYIKFQNTTLIVSPFSSVNPMVYANLYFLLRAKPKVSMFLTID